MEPTIRDRYGKSTWPGEFHVAALRWLDGRTKQAGGAVAGLGLALLGPPVITWDGRPVSFDTKKATAVLALLAVEGRELSRERLAALLWPETDTSRARASLRRTL